MVNELLKIIHKILFQKYDEEFKSQILDKNLRVTAILLPLMTLIATIHIILFSYNLSDYSGIELYWLQSLILAHAFIGIFALTFSIYQYLSCNYLLQLKSTLKTLSHLVYIVGLGSSITLAIIDQMITYTVTPYLIALVFIPIIIIIDIKFSVLYILLAHLVFLILYTNYQYNPDLILSGVVNSSSAAILSVLISYFNWSKNLSEYQYRKKIKEQQDELNKRNVELLKFNKNLSDINNEKDKFFSIVAHDLRSPVGNFKTLINELINSYEIMGEEERKETIHQINISSINTYNLLEWAKSQMSSSLLNKTENDLYELINICIKLNETNLANKSINLIFNNPSASSLVNFDYNLLKSGILNLLSNAIKFSNLAGIIEVNAIQTKNDILVSVKDYGVGMNDKQLENLFILSKKQSQIGTKGEIGSGLGLILVKDIIEKHNGKIWINSEINNGSTFTFSLPLN